MVLVPSPSEIAPPSPPWTLDLDGRDFVIVDLETTGGSPNHDRIIEIAAVRVRSGRIRECWHSLVNPETTVPPFITGLTGITTGLVANAPRFAEVADAFLTFV